MTISINQLIEEAVLFLVSLSMPADEARQNAIWLLAHILNKSPSHILLNRETILSSNIIHKFTRQLNQFKSDKPLQYIIG